MATTTNYAFTKPTVGASRSTWGASLNDNWDLIDQILGDRQFNTVDDLVANYTTGDLDDYTLVCAGGMIYYTQDGANVPGLTQGVIPLGRVFADHFKTNVTPGTTDMTDAIASALAYARRAFLKRSTYLTTSPLISTAFNAGLVCDEGLAILLGGHLTGPVLQFRRSGWDVFNVNIRANSAREAEDHDVLNAGFISGDFQWDYDFSTIDWAAVQAGSESIPEVNGQPVVGASAAWGNMDTCFIQNHPGPAYVAIGSGGTLERSRLSGNKGHGAMVDTGQSFGIDLAGELGFPGWSRIAYNKIEFNGGHKIALGSPDTGSGQGGASNAIYRYDLINNDGSDNATDAAVRYVNRELYIVGEGIYGRNNSVGTTGLYIAGRQHMHDIYRVVGTTVATPCQIGRLPAYGNRDITAQNFDVNSPAEPITNLWDVDDNIVVADDVKLFMNSVNADDLASDADKARLLEWKFGGRRAYNGITFFEGTFEPSFRFETAGDAVFDLTVDVDSFAQCRYKQVTKDLAWINVATVFSVNSYTTAAGVFLVDLNAGLPFDMSAAAIDRTALTVGNLFRFSLPNTTTREGIVARVNNDNTLRIERFQDSGAIEPFTTDNVPPGTGDMSIVISGFVVIA